MNEMMKYAKILWDYHHLYQKIEASDCIIAFGSHDTHVAQRAAELFLEGKADCIIFTGGLGRITKNIWHVPEAVKFKEIAVACGVNPDSIYVESQSANTGENIAFTKKLIAEKQLAIRSVIAVDKPFKERRLYATLKKQWEDLHFTVASPLNTFEEYCAYYMQSDELSLEDFISIMTGDLQRIDIYGKNGFQIPQSIPVDVRDAYERLVSMGYDTQLLK